MIESAERHSGFNQRIIDVVLSQCDAEARCKATNESRKLYEWARQVSCDLEKTKAFTRFEIHEKGILYASISPEHYIEDLVADFFAERFPMFVIVLESRRGCFVKKKGQRAAVVNERMESVLAKLDRNLENDNMLCDLLDFDDKSIWRIFYNSANIKQRNNRKYFLRNMPRKYHDLQGLDEEKNAFDGNQRLLAYQ